MVPWPSGQITPAFEDMKAIQQLPKLPKGLMAQPGIWGVKSLQSETWPTGTGDRRVSRRIHLPSFTTSIDHAGCTASLTALLEVLCDKWACLLNDLLFFFVAHWDMVVSVEIHHVMQYCIFLWLTCLLPQPYHYRLYLSNKVSTSILALVFACLHEGKDAFSELGLVIAW